MALAEIFQLEDRPNYGRGRRAEEIVRDQHVRPAAAFVRAAITTVAYGLQPVRLHEVTDAASPLVDDREVLRAGEFTDDFLDELRASRELYGE
jgi:hypothetical protein